MHAHTHVNKVLLHLRHSMFFALDQLALFRLAFHPTGSAKEQGECEDRI